MKDRSTMTEPAARGTFSANVTQWAIYDAYEEERMNAQQGGGNSVAANAASSSSANSAATTTAASGNATLSKPEIIKVFLHFIYFMFAYF